MHDCKHGILIQGCVVNKLEKLQQIRKHLLLIGFQYMPGHKNTEADKSQVYDSKHLIWLDEPHQGAQCFGSQPPTCDWQFAGSSTNEPTHMPWQL